MKRLIGSTALAVVLAAISVATAAAQQQTVKIGVLSDMSSLYSDVGGPGSTAAAKLAIADFAATNKDLKVELVSADHQNKPDIGSNVANQWFDVDKVDMIVDVPNSGVALAVSQVAANKNKVFVVSGAAASDLTGAKCNANTVHWTYDTWMLAHSVGGATVRAGGDSWYFITADYAFGHALERDTSGFIKAAGGKILGGVRTPFPGTSDFSSFLVQAQASGAKVIGLANAGTDTTNCVKQAAEFGLGKRGVKLASLLLFITEVHSLGLRTAAGLIVTESFYWDLNDRTRALTARVRPQIGNAGFASTHAGTYAGTLHYLKAVADMGVAAAKASGADAVARMKAMPTDDDAFGAGRIREDGRKLHPAYLFEVKTPCTAPGCLDKG
jgi:branched-chain amino acid transport system substrate-binding protein